MQSQRVPPSLFSRFSSRTALWFALALYIPLQIAAVISQREQMNFDGISYLRLSQYIVEGRLSDSISSYWSPLITWSMAPLLALGLDGFVASHIAMSVWGAFYVIAIFFFLRSFSRLSTLWEMAFMSLAAFVAVSQVGRLVAPDVILASLLLLYFAVTLSSSLFEKKGTAAAAGILGGVAYLAKSYALPFFLVHFTSVVGLRYILDRKPRSRDDVVKTWLTAVLAFAVVAAPWIATISIQQKHLTFSSVARVAHTIVGPTDMPREHPTEELRAPAPGHLTIWETPERLPYNTWSPFESVAYLKHQASLVKNNLSAIIDTLRNLDFLSLFPAALVLIPLFTHLYGNHNALKTWWVWITLAIYVGGFTLVFFEPRYIVPLAWALCSVYLFEAFSANHSRSRMMTLLMTICILSLAYPPLYEINSLIRHRKPPTLRALAAELKQSRIQPPIAASPANKLTGLIVAYHLGQPYDGPVTGTTTAEVEAQLEEFNVGTFLVWDDWALANAFRQETRWHLDRTFTRDGMTIYVFTRPSDRSEAYRSGFRASTRY